jgi:hypothetical protein
VAGSKFRDAPAVDVASNASIQLLTEAVSALVAARGVPGVNFFAVSADGMGKFIKSVSVNHVDPPRKNRPPGLYTIVDSSDNENPGVLVTAFQTYHYDKDFRQKNTDGFQPGDNFVGPRSFVDGDLVILRAVQILRGPTASIVA